MAAYEVLLLNTAVPQIQAAQAGDTYVVPRDIAVTANLSVTGNTTLGDAATDTVQVNGYMGVGGAGASSVGVYVTSSALTGVNQAGVLGAVTGSSAATTSIRAISGDPSTAAAVFTVANMVSIYAANGNKGAGSTITNNHGVFVSDQTLGTNNYGVTSQVSSGTDKWNIYASGTAANYFAGNVQFAAGTAAAPALTRFGDDNTGIFFPAADTIAFSEGGAEAMRIDSAGNVGIGTTTPTEKLDVVGNIKASGSIIAPYIYAGNIATIGSFTWNTATNSPAAAINVGTTTVTPIHSGMRRCLMNDSGVVQYYLSPTDSALKADGTASVLTGADGQVMVEIPAFYTRREVSGTFITWYVSPVELPGYTLHPAFTKDGVQVPFRYYSAYDACVYDVSASSYIAGQNYDNNSGAGNGVEVDVTATTGDVLASVSGVYPMVGLTRAENRTIAANRGTGWRQLDWALFSAVQLLYLIEHQSFFSQNILGAGNTATTYATTAADPTQAGNGASEAGKSNSLGNGSTNTTTGASSASRQVAFMSYRGIENFYGNDWNWADGVIVNPDGTVSADQGDWWFTNNSADFSDSVRTNMTQITAVGATGSGFSSAIAAVDYFFVATSVSGGSSTTFLTDQSFGSTSADRVVRVGGPAAFGADAGAFLVSSTDASSSRARSIAARLSF